MTGPDVGEEVEVTPCMWCIILAFCYIFFAVTLFRSAEWRHRKRQAQAATDLETPPSAWHKEYTYKKCGQKEL